MTRVLYVGAANLAQPTSGLDLASCAHFDELAADPRIDLTAISVSAVPLPPPGTAPRPAATLFAGDMLARPGAGARWREKLGLLARGGVLFHSGFTCRAARAAVRAALAGPPAAAPQVVVIDNKSALANLPLPRLIGVRLRRRTRIVIVAHDASADVLRDQASVAPGRMRALALWLHAWHLHLFETVALALAHRVVFLSAADRARFRLPAAKASTLCPVLDSPAAVEAPSAPELVFLGSPAFFANAVAIDWIVNRFAPALAELEPALRIVLVGKGTDRQAGVSANVTGLGFVATDDLHRRLGAASGLLSPVDHGSGIKIKVLEALACGCPVFATAASLRGYEFMALEPLLDIADPVGSARRVAAIAGDPAGLAAYRARTVERWARFRHERRGKLADAILAEAS